MGNCVVDWIFRRQKFCCCLPVRLGAALLSLLSLLLVGVLTVIIWFEVASAYFVSYYLLSNRSPLRFFLCSRLIVLM